MANAHRPECGIRILGLVFADVAALGRILLDWNVHMARLERRIECPIGARAFGTLPETEGARYPFLGSGAWER